MDLADIAPFLEELGIDPNIIPPGKLQKIMSCMQKFADSPQITTQVVEEMSKIMGVSLHGKIPGDGGEALKAKTRTRVGKVGRNDVCPCKSGKKYKKCCMIIGTT